MSSAERAKRFCTVAGKVGYPTYAEALAKLALRQDRAVGVARLLGSVYTCPSCEDFHLSSRKFTLVKRKGRGKTRRRLLERVA
jgi:hypothetical protein